MLLYWCVMENIATYIYYNRLDRLCPRLFSESHTRALLFDSRSENKEAHKYPRIDTNKMKT